jgi:ribonucleoside-diphosphate reductase alpha chain
VGTSTLTSSKKKKSKPNAESKSSTSAKGVKIKRLFTRGPDGQRVDPMESLVWERRDAKISGADGAVVFEQKDLEIPAGWSQLATNVVASKYFRGPMGSPERESSVRQLIGRVVESVRTWGLEQGYFESKGDAAVFADELSHLLVEQKASFNSPVWFNVGVEEHPQCSACFILSVEDTMESILDW